MNNFIVKNKFSFAVGLVSALYLFSMYTVLETESNPHLRVCCDQLNFEKSYINSVITQLKIFIKNDDCEGLETFINNLT